MIFASLLRKILKKNIFEKKIYNLSSNKPIQIKDIIKTLKKNKNYKRKYKYKKKR